MSAFFDTNILVYTMIQDPRGAHARNLLQGGGVIGVQVLNEFTRVTRNKLKLEWPTIETALRSFRDLLTATPLTLAIHEKALKLAKQDGVAIFDALIVAAALESDCDTLFSEDLQDGRAFGGLKIVNPFRT